MSLVSFSPSTPGCRPTTFVMELERNGSGSSMVFSSRSFTLHAASLAEVSDSILDLENRYYVSVGLNLQVHRPFCDINLDGQNLIISMVCVYILGRRSQLQFFFFFLSEIRRQNRHETQSHAFHKNRSLCQAPACSHMI